MEHLDFISGLLLVCWQGILVLFSGGMAVLTFRHYREHLKQISPNKR